MTVDHGGAQTRLALQVYDSPDGNMLADWSQKARGVTVERNEHGTAVISASVPMLQDEVFRWLARSGIAHAAVSGLGLLAATRLEDVKPDRDGITIGALGYWRALSDTLYTALWSTTDYRRFSVVNADTPGYSSVGSVPELYQTDNNGRLYIAARGGETFGALDQCHYLLQVPDDSQRNIVGVMFSYEFAALSSWRFQVRSDTTALLSVTSAGSPLAGAEFLSLATPSAGLRFKLENVGGADPADTGDVYLKITDLRVVTDDTNEIDTTVSASIAAGSQTVTPADMTGVYIGQKLVIDDGSNSEIVEVTDISASTFTATFANSYGANSTVRAPLIYADTIAADLADRINTTNPHQLSDSAALLESPRLDLTDEIYEDERPSKIMNYLAGLGDSDGNRWECGVTNDRLLYLRQRGSYGRTWYVDEADLSINYTISDMYNRTYATQPGANRRTLRTANANDEDSQAIHNLIRRQVTRVNTTLPAQAEAHRDALLNDKATPTPRASLTTSRLYIAENVPAPLDECRPGDIIVIRTLPPTASGSAVDRVRSFVVSRTRYDIDANLLSLIPEGDPDELEYLVARENVGAVNYRGSD